MTTQLSQSPSQTFGGRPSLLTDLDLYLFAEGTHYRLYEKLGAHYISQEGVEGLYFAVWAPNARFVRRYRSFCIVQGVLPKNLFR